MSSVYQSVVGWRHALESILMIGCQLSDPAWSFPTECPKWTVKDIYAHLVGGEQWMANGQPHVPDGEMAQWAAAPVLARRDTPPTAVLLELRLAYEQRRVQLEREPLDPTRPSYFPGFPGADAPTLGQVLQLRAFDVWTHEQDIRRAIGKPGNLAGPAAAIAAELFISTLPRIVANSAKAPPGSTVRLTTRGEVELDAAVAVNRDGRGRLVAPGRVVTTHLVMSWETYARLSCGRGTRGDHEIRVNGDRPLGERVLDRLVITP